MNPYEYEIYIYEDEKQIDTLTRRSADYLKPEIREDIPGGFSGVVSGNFIFESDHKIFVFYDGKRASWLDVFEDRKMAASVQVKGSLFAIDHQGKFYFIENTDYPKIVRYSASGL